MSSIGVVSRDVSALVDRGAIAAGDDWSDYQVIAADPDHLSMAIRRIIRENLEVVLLPLSGHVERDTRSLRNPPDAQLRSTLALCDTGLEHRQYGFTLGLGALFHAADRGRAGRLSAIRGALQRVKGSVTVDGERLGDAFTLAAVSTTPEFPMRLRAPMPPAQDEVCFLWNNLGAAGFIQHGLALMRGIAEMPSHRAGVARRVQFDVENAGYTLDGALRVADTARVISVSRGPDVQVCQE